MLDSREKCISASPVRYAQWIECFDIISERLPDSGEFELLCSGKCEDSAQSVTYLENQLIAAINSMMKQCISRFTRELQMYITFGETENIHIPYVRFSQRIKMCMFFRNLDFMSVQFRRALEASVRSETEKFWKSACRGLYDSCIQQPSPQLEDEIHIIRRIRLFRNEDLL